MYNNQGGHTVVYDPSSKVKAACKRTVVLTLRHLGIRVFPLFVGRPLKLTVVFGIKIQTKDIYNLMKVIMDALQKVVYANDVAVMKQEVDKRHVENGFTKLKVELINE